METRHKVIGGIVAAVVLGGVFYAGTASAKSTGGEPFVLQFFKTVGYKQLPIAVPAMTMVDPDPTSKGPRLIDWAKAEQARGRMVLVPAIYYQGVTTGSPSQILSVDEPTGKLMITMGIFKQLSKV